MIDLGALPVQPNPLKATAKPQGEVRENPNNSKQDFSSHLQANKKDVKSKALNPKKPGSINKDNIHRAQREDTAKTDGEKTVSERVVPQKKTVATAQTKEEKIAIEPMTRTKAMSQFLAKMQEELGVDPFDLIEAYSKLSNEALSMAPENTVKSVIEGLDLDTDQSAVAEKLYNNMLNQTASSNMASYLKESNNELSLEVMSEKQVKRNELNNSISRLNENFFMNGKGFEQKSVQANPQAAAGAYATQATNTEAALSGLNGSPLEAAPLDQPIGKNAQSLNAFGENSTKDVGDVLKQMTSVENKNVDTKSIDMQALQKMIEQELAPTAKATTASEAEVDTTNLMQAKESITSQPNANESLQSLSGQNLSAFQNSTDGDTENTEDGEFMEFKSAEKGPQNLTKAEKFTLSPTAKMTSADESANVREVITQAQYLAKKGGGEMKVKLNPDGLGEVNLKVKTHDGQVSVELITQNNDVKKLFEKGLGDLKATLMSHKVNVDQIKVDVAGDMQNSLEQQQEQAERQFQHRFLDDFQRNNEQWRNGFFDTSGARSTKSQTDDPAMNDYEARRAKGNRRLDLVA